MEHYITMSHGYHSWAYDCYYVKATCKCGAIIKGPADKIEQLWLEHRDLPA